MSQTLKHLALIGLSGAFLAACATKPDPEPEVVAQPEPEPEVFASSDTWPIAAR